MNPTHGAGLETRFSEDLPYIYMKHVTDQSTNGKSGFEITSVIFVKVPDSTRPYQKTQGTKGRDQ